MSDIKIGYSDYVRFALKADGRETFWMNQEPGGWSEDELELDRHKDYHGIFIQFSSKLKFWGDAKDYIEEAYALNGPNVKIRLIKYITKDVVDDDGSKTVKWVERYSAIADTTTKVVEGNLLSISFNNNDLAELIKAHEGDSFEIERDTSIDDEPLDALETLTTEIKTRNLSTSGESVLDLDPETVNIEKIIDENGNERTIQFLDFPVTKSGYKVVNTKIAAQGNARHTAVNFNEFFPETNPTTALAQEALCFSDELNVNTGIVNVKFTVSFLAKARKTTAFNTFLEVFAVKYEWDDDTELMTEIATYPIVNNEPITSETAYNTTFDITYYNEIELNYNQGICIRWDINGGAKIRLYDFNFKFTTDEFYESSPQTKFIFTHDVYERLLYIMTGEKNRFYSKFFGRTEIGYAQDGIAENGDIGGGLIGMTSGFWVRLFNPQSEKYKSLQVSLKDLMDSCTTVFNTGAGIETINFKERLRVEELKYFYRNETVVRLPYQITNVKRSIDSKLFFSGTELGYRYGGEYEEEVGLDEPNTRTNTVTPLRVGNNKYQKTSFVRADETGMEITRRKPQTLYPDEDTSQDEHNWFLDMKRSTDGGFEQADYTDRMDTSYTPTGINSPPTFRSMIFTPLRLLFRHGWIIRSCLEWYKSKKIIYTKSKGNVSLKMKFPNEQEYGESDDILVSSLERSRFTPDIVDFEHPVDEDLIDLIFGKTKKIINGEEEEVPNFYFKFEWVDENGEIERGYLLNFKPKGAGKFKMRIANERV